MPGNKLGRIMDMYTELDRLYFKKFPKKNMVNLLFVIQYLCKKLGYLDIAERIKINRNEKTLENWEEKLNLAFSQ